LSKTPIQSSEQVGRLVRDVRKESGLTQKEAAAFCNVGVRFLSDLENGKSSAYIGKTFQVLQRLGINLYAEKLSTKKALDTAQPEMDFEKKTNKKIKASTGVNSYKSNLEEFISTHTKQKEKLKILERNLLGLKSQIDMSSLTGTKLDSRFVEEQNKLLNGIKQMEKGLALSNIRESLDRLTAPFNRSIEELKTLSGAKTPPSTEAFEASIKRLGELNLQIDKLRLKP